MAIPGSRALTNSIDDVARRVVPSPIYLTMGHNSDLKGLKRILYYRQEDSEIARRIVDYVSDIEILKSEAILAAQEFHIYLQ